MDFRRPRPHNRPLSELQDLTQGAGCWEHGLEDHLAPGSILTKCLPISFVLWLDWNTMCIWNFHLACHYYPSLFIASTLGMNIHCSFWNYLLNSIVIFLYQINMLHILAFLYFIIQQAAQTTEVARGLSQPLRGPSETLGDSWECLFFFPFSLACLCACLIWRSCLLFNDFLFSDQSRKSRKMKGSAKYYL